ncbi:MAG: hypothetical protein QOD93_6897 [Acetobacteraceae bacterium]|jgi:hypothetical protein|nr:hypothetical protein [Acetobacteraceae bacterium]
MKRNCASQAGLKACPVAAKALDRPISLNPCECPSEIFGPGDLRALMTPTSPGDCIPFDRRCAFRGETEVTGVACEFGA